MQSSLKVGMFAVLGANVVNLIFSLLTNFLLPKFLSVDSYAYIKTFQLYSSYVGIFALGYADGMYLRYGGKALEAIDKSELKNGLYTFRLFLLLESLILIPLSFLTHDKVLIGFVFTILTKNLIGYFKNLYQAVGEFKKYGRILNLTTILTFVANMLLLLIIKTDNYFIYLICYAVVDGIIYSMLEINSSHFFKDYPQYSFSLKLLFEDMKSGFLLMIGNFSNILLSSMDRWFVKAVMDSAAFAYYSFAVSLEGFLNIATTPITVTLYNYFCNHLQKEQVVKTRKYVLIFGTYIIAAAFPAKFIIEIYLQKYEESLVVLFILFATQVLYVVIKGIYVNLYKAKKQQAKYFYKLVSILVIGASLNCIFIKAVPVKEAFAYATLVSSALWLIISALDFNEYPFTLKEIIYLVVEVGVFITTGYLFVSVVGFFIYILITLFLSMSLLNNETKYLILMVADYIKKEGKL